MNHVKIDKGRAMPSKQEDSLVLGGVLLCGGASRRMGRPKAWLPWGSQTLLEHLLAVLGEVTPRLVVVAAPGQVLPPLPSTVRLRFDPVEYQGPLQGIQVGLNELSNDVDAAFVLSCDTPFMNPGFVKAVCGCLADHEIAMPRDEHHHHPLAAAYRTSLLPTIEALLAEDKRRPRFLIDQADTFVIDVDELKASDPAGLALSNINTPEDYQQALIRRAALQQESR